MGGGKGRIVQGRSKREKPFSETRSSCRCAGGSRGTDKGTSSAREGGNVQTRFRQKKIGWVRKPKVGAGKKHPPGVSKGQPGRGRKKLTGAQEERSRGRGGKGSVSCYYGKNFGVRLKPSRSLRTNRRGGG